ncbi:4Fe-4S binding protein [Eggerthella guodeyinii]|nr:4Fe-4S binding protein [Eggerthella guodeyinii]
MAAEATVVDAMADLGRLTGYGLDAHPERCVRVRNRHASCARCAEACTSGAISFCDGSLVVAQDRCVGCGTCATVCPTCALETCHPNDADLLARASDARGADGAVTFACHEAWQGRADACAAAGAVELACLSRLDESLLMELRVRGARTIVLVHGACENCPRAAGWRSVELVARTMETIADAWGVDCAVVLTDELPAAEDGVSRERDVLRERFLRLPERDVPPDAARGVGEPPAPSADVVEATRKPVHVMVDGTLPHFVPLRRHRLLDALATLGDPVAERLDTRLWGHIRIDASRCRSCMMCTVFCPTGALARYATDAGETGVEHYVAECVHCGLCQDVCPEHAIVSSTNVSALQLARGETERCPLPDPVWRPGPDQILRRMQPQIGGNEVRHSY